MQFWALWPKKARDTNHNLPVELVSLLLVHLKSATAAIMLITLLSLRFYGIAQRDLPSCSRQRLDAAQASTDPCRRRKSLIERINKLQGQPGHTTPPAAQEHQSKSQIPPPSMTARADASERMNRTHQLQKVAASVTPVRPPEKNVGLVSVRYNTNCRVS